MEILLSRRWKKDSYTIGKLSVDGKYFCDTLEDAVRNLVDKDHDGDFTDPGEGKVYGQTAIPAGRYKVVLHFWEKHQKDYPLLLDVPGFTGIYIHSGNSAKDSEGCLLIGKNTKPGRIVNGPYYLNQLVELMRNAKDETFITVK